MNSELLKTLIHYFLHLAFPMVLAWLFFRDRWKKAYLLMLATMLVDIDHLLASPVFDPHRSSIGFHLLHSYPAIAAYALGVVLLRGNYRIIATGLLFHMLTDFLDFYFWN